MAAACNSLRKFSFIIDFFQRNEYNFVGNKNTGMLKSSKKMWLYRSLSCNDSRHGSTLSWSKFMKPWTFQRQAWLAYKDGPTSKWLVMMLQQSNLIAYIGGTNMKTKAIKFSCTRTWVPARFLPAIIIRNAKLLLQERLQEGANFIRFYLRCYLANNHLTYNIHHLR